MAKSDTTPYGDLCNILAGISESLNKLVEIERYKATIMAMEARKDGHNPPKIPE